MVKMPRCPNCSYKLVLLSSRPKYKCALCSKLYPKKEIEVKEFQEFNKRRRIEDMESYEKERKEHLTRIREIKKDLRLLFNGFSKTPKEYRKWYYEKHKEKIKQLIEKIYPEESMEFKIHIPVLLITRKVVETIFGKELYEEIIKDEMKRDVLNSAWPEVNSIYDRFKKDIIKFLKNEKLS